MMKKKEIPEKCGNPLVTSYKYVNGDLPDVEPGRYFFCQKRKRHIAYVRKGVKAARNAAEKLFFKDSRKKRKSPVPTVRKETEGQTAYSERSHDMVILPNSRADPIADGA